MKRLMVLATLAFSTLCCSETGMVGAESFLSKNGELSFKLQNYSKTTAFDCIISYDLRTYDEDHAYLRTAANLQTKVIFIDKNSQKRVKADFELMENEKVAELAHAVKEPLCVPATRSRAVALKDHYNFSDYIRPRTGAGLGLMNNRGIIFKVDFKEITQFEIAASKEVDLGNGYFIGGGMSFVPEIQNFGGSEGMMFFLTERRRTVSVPMTTVSQPDAKGAINYSSTNGLYYYNTSKKEIVKFEVPAKSNCGVILSTDYLMCSEDFENSVPVLINPLNGVQLNFDPTAQLSLNDMNSDLKKCQLKFETTMDVNENQARISQSCHVANMALERFDVIFDLEKENNQSILKFSSYEDIKEESLNRDDVRKGFPSALFVKNSPKPAAYEAYSPKETLQNAAKRLFKKDVKFISIINVDKVDFFDVFFVDEKNNSYYGRIYWNDLQ